MNLLTLLLSTFMLFSLQCRHKIDYASDLSAHNEKSAESLELRAKWMKYKGDKVDVGVQIVNGYKRAMVLKYHEFVVEMDGDKGYLASPRSATFEIEPGETMTRELTFRFERDKVRKGPVNLTIRKIHSGTIDKPGKEVPDLVLELPLTP